RRNEHHARSHPLRYGSLVEPMEVDVIFTFGIAVALAAAARSTWSPCGLSMLSQITPGAEAGRSQPFSRTARWFIAGATLGGLMLGGAIAGVAVALAAV